MNPTHEAQQELKQLFAALYPDVSGIILRIGQDKNLDRQIRSSCPVSDCQIRGSKNFILRYQIWPRLFSKDLERITKAIEFLKGLEARNV